MRSGASRWGEVALGVNCWRLIVVQVVEFFDARLSLRELYMNLGEEARACSMRVDSGLFRRNL